MDSLPKELQTNNDYGARRRDVMSDVDIELAERYLDYFRSSYMDKDNRGLFDKWEMIDLYWEGEAHPPESDNDPGSNTNIVNPNVEGQVAYLVDQNISISTKGRGPSDVPFSNTARTLLEFVKEKNKLKRKLDVHERRREKFGTGIFRVLFDPDMLDGMGLPVIEPCNPAYVFTDPNITDIYKVQEGRFAIEIMNKSLSWAKENYDEDLVAAIEPGYEPMETNYIFGEEDGESDEISKDHYMHMLVFTRHKGEIRLVEMSGCGVILRDTAKKKKPEKEDKEEAVKDTEDGDELPDDDATNEIYFPDSRYPYFLTPDMYREGTVWAKGTAELLVNTQDLIDDLDDQIRINARLTGNPQREVHVNSGVDPDKLTNEPGLAIPVNESGGLKFLEPPTMPQYIMDRRNQALGMERQIVSRFGDQQVGVKQQGVDTATESLSLQQGANSGINHKKALLEETLSEVFEYCLDLIQEYWTEEEAFRITEKEDDFLFFRPSSLREIPKLIPATDSYKTRFMENFPDAENTPKYMQLMNGSEPVTKQAAFDVTVSVGAGLPNNPAFVYNLIKEAHKDQAINQTEYRRMLADYTGLPIESEMQPDMSQIQQMIQQMAQQAIQSAMMGVAPAVGADIAQNGLPQQNPNVMGMSPGGSPALSVVQGGGM
ncbi:hypothetical protein [Paenibacillus contaminans]|uniref:Uncharacterized protein n=1 Tax=Paenibacillus contaminans TaxID=450362 RepID=A0A329MQF2_9BACL|nr:hypothetical protein [Paenibacillus contaminans]RAV22211.1 hypothetical protein DQG23_04465 [Paenibacillus contaminans]